MAFNNRKPSRDQSFQAPYGTSNSRSTGSSKSDNYGGNNNSKNTPGFRYVGSFAEQAKSSSYAPKQSYAPRSNSGSGSYSAPQSAPAYKPAPSYGAPAYNKPFSSPRSPAAKSYDRFQNRNEYVHGGSYTLKNAWQGGGHQSRGGFGGGHGGYGGRGGRSGGGRGRGGRGEQIDVSRFIKKAVGPSKQTVVIKHSFADFGFIPEIQKNLEDKGYVTPSPIQDQSIKHVQAGKDIIGLANTGTGKTAAFLLPLIEKVAKDPQNQSVLILAPTRELAIQIEDEFRIFAKGLKLFSAICVGGVPAYTQIQDLRRNPHFVIGTPGRIQDLADRRFINFEIYNNVVLDEVDHMLDMGFVEPITDILSNLPAERQSLFFSATMPDRIRSLISNFVKDPVLVEIQSGKTTDNVEQDIVRVTDRSKKLETLIQILKREDVKKVLIFSETKADVERLYDALREAGFKAASIHGDKRQRERQRALGFFKDNTINILVATDVAARGIDVKDISHVINYTIPQTHDDYVHRIGRTGRGGSTGTALTFV